MNCPKCGHNPQAVIGLRWSFFIEREVASLNAYRTNHGGSRWAYKRDRDAWHTWFIALGRQHCVTTPPKVRRVTLTRLYAGRQREFDADNLAGGCKVVVDAMVRAGLLRGDDKASAEILYQQRKVAGSAVTSVTGLEVLIEEFST